MLNILLMPVLAAVSINASDAQSLLESARALQAERWADVDNYTVTLAVEASGGLQTSIHYEKMVVDGQATFRMVPPGEYNRELTEFAGFPAGEEVMEQMAPHLDILGGAAAQGGGDMPPMDVRGMTSQMSAFARATAEHEVDDGRADAADAVRDMAEFARRARLEGTEAVRAASGDPQAMREAYLLVADDLSDVQLDQPEGDARFSLAKVSLWLETEHLVPLRLLMEGEVEHEGKKMPLRIERLDLDYKQVGPLYESHHQSYSLSGLMAGLSDKDRKELEKAKVEFEKAKAQLASMPDGQRAMVEKMMKSQMAKFEAMTAGDAISSTTDVVSVAINEGPPTAGGPGSLTVGGPVAASFPGAMTIAAADPHAELAVAARIPAGIEAAIGLIGVAPFPQSGQVEIGDATGSVRVEGGAQVSIDGGSGIITVTERSKTRIKGTFTALLTGDSEGGRVDFEASGSFDSGAPIGPFQGPRGSPIPHDLFEAP